MASRKLGLFLLAPVLAFLFLSSPAQCSDKEDSVLKGINSFRQTLNLPSLNQVTKAACLADEVADEIEDVPCENVNQFYPAAAPAGGGVGANAKIPNLQKHIDKCDIDINTTTDGVILPVCVSKLEPTVVLSNYTHSDRYARYLNNSRYSGLGLGSEDDWMVLVLTTNTTAGSFSAAAAAAAATSLLANAAAWNNMHLLLFALLLVLLLY